MESAFLFSGKMQEVEMFIQTKCNELSFADLIRATKDTTDESKKFPYKTFVARCGNCQFCYKGKCSLKECCCMGDRVKAGSCSFTELLNHCFRNIGDNVFRFRLRIAAERAAEEHSCFLSKEHFKRFREGCALTHRNDNGFIAQLFLLSADETLWKQVSDLLFDGKFSYIRLTELVPELLEMVDNGRMGFRPAVEISYLQEEEQRDLVETIDTEDCTPSLAQAIRMKELSREGKLDMDTIFGIMTEEKPNQREKIKDMESYEKTPITEFNDVMVRRLVDNIRVMPNHKIVVVLRGGMQREEPI